MLIQDLLKEFTFDLQIKIIPSELSRPTITKWYGPLDIDIAKDIDDKVNLLKEELGIG